MVYNELEQLRKIVDYRDGPVIADNGQTVFFYKLVQLPLSSTQQ
jgi:hypothetical protein